MVINLQDYAALFVSIVALVLSYLGYRHERLTSNRPVLVFSMSSHFQWTLTNVGNGPATNLLVGDGSVNGTYEVVNCYPLAAGASLPLTWLRTAWKLSAVYSDALGRSFTTTCHDNKNVIVVKNLHKDWTGVRHQWLESLYGEGRATATVHKDSDLAGKSALELDIMRNRIFARHGYIFRRHDLDTYFRRQPWYEPRFKSAAEVEGKMSPGERYDVHAILRFQHEHGLKTTSPQQELLDPAFSLEPPTSDTSQAIKKP